jgi:hypothetical protein
MRASRLSHKSIAGPCITFADLFGAHFGDDTVGRRTVLMRLEKKKMQIIGFGRPTGNPTVGKSFFRDGTFAIPFEGTWNHYYLMVAYIWMNRIANGNHSWKSYDDVGHITLRIGDWLPPFTETFDDCWRDGAMTHSPENNMALAKAILGIMQKLTNVVVTDADRVLRNTAEVDTSPRTMIFMDALSNKKTMGEVMQVMFPYYATIYKDEYPGDNGVTALTGVEPWPTAVCPPGRKNANRYIRKLFQKSQTLAGGGTMIDRAGAGNRRPTSAPSSQKSKQTKAHAVGDQVEVFIPHEKTWNKAVITKKNKNGTFKVTYTATGTTWSSTKPEHVRAWSVADGAGAEASPPTPRVPQVVVNEGEIPFIIGTAVNSKATTLTFKAMSQCPAVGAAAPFYAFQEGGAGNNFVMRHGTVSGGVIGALGSSSKSMRVVMMEQGEAVTQVRGACITFHPLFVNMDGTARVQLLSQPVSVKLGGTFCIADIQRRHRYIGCVGLCLNGKKNLHDGRGVSEVAWALQVVHDTS